MNPDDYSLALLLEINDKVSFVIVAPDDASLEYALKAFTSTKVNKQLVQHVTIASRQEPPVVETKRFVSKAVRPKMT